MHARLLTALAFAASLLLASVAHAQPVDLRPKFVKGQEQRLDLAIESTSTTRFTGDAPIPAQDAAISQRLGILLRCKAADAEGATVELVYESIRVSVKSAGFNEEFDSTAPGRRPTPGRATPPVDHNPLESILRPMVGATLTLRLDPDGNITSVTGGAELTATGPLASIARDMQNPTSVTNLFQGITTVRRQPGTVAVGETWQTVSRLDSGIGAFKITTDHTLQSHRAGRAAIPFVGRIEPDSEAPGARFFQIRDSISRGTAVWDTERGALFSLESRQSVAVDVNLGGASGTMKSESSLRVTRRDGPAGPVFPAPPDGPGRRGPGLPKH